MVRNSGRSLILTLAAMLGCGITTSSTASTGAPHRVVLGQTWTIAEPDTLQEIETAAKARDWRSWLRSKPKDYSAFRSASLPRATRGDSRLFDPTYTLPEDVKDERGRVLIARGTRVNVYERLQVPGRYIVIEPSAAHYRWLGEVAKPVSGDKVLLANGNVLEERERTARDLFQLDARFIERFGLRAVPSIVRQEGTMLRVEEYALAP